MYCCVPWVAENDQKNFLKESGSYKCIKKYILARNSRWRTTHCHWREMNQRKGGGDREVERKEVDQRSNQKEGKGVDLIQD